MTLWLLIVLQLFKKIAVTGFPYSQQEYSYSPIYIWTWEERLVLWNNNTVSKIDICVYWYFWKDHFETDTTILGNKRRRPVVDVTGELISVAVPKLLCQRSLSHFMYFISN